MAELYSEPTTIQSLTDYGDFDDEPSIMSYRSETIHPIETASRTCRFRLEPFGFLGGESMLLFKMQGTVTGDKLRANIMSGGLAALKTARLQVGDTVILETRDFHLVSMADQVIKKDRDSLAKYHSHYWGCAFQSKGVADATEGAHEGATAGQVVMDVDECGIKFGKISDGSDSAVQSQAITQTLGDNYQVGIRLGEIFPVLDREDFPLFLFDQYRIHIFLEFNDANVFVNSLVPLDSGTPADKVQKTLAAGADEVSYADRKLQIDYKIFPSAVLDAQRARTAREGGLQLTYYDIKTIEKQLPATAAGVSQDVEFRLGLQNLEVHEIMMLKRLTTADGASFHGRNQSLLLDMTCNCPEVESYQVDVNGIPSFPFFMSHQGSKYNRFREAKAHDIFMERPFFYGDANDLASRITTRSSGLQGTYEPLCIDMRNGMPFIRGGGTIAGQYPLVWKYKRTPKDAVADQNNAQQGDMDVVFLCKTTKQAVIQSTDKGMVVSVREQQ